MTVHTLSPSTQGEEQAGGILGVPRSVWCTQNSRTACLKKQDLVLKANKQIKTSTHFCNLTLHFS